MTAVYISTCSQDSLDLLPSDPLHTIGALKAHPTEPSPRPTEDPMLRYTSDLAYNIAEAGPACPLSHINAQKDRLPYAMYLAAPDWNNISLLSFC